MSYRYDREELVKAVSSTMSDFFLAGVGEATGAVEIRQRVEAMAQALARVQAVIACEGDLGTEVLMDIRSLERHHLRTLLETMHLVIRPTQPQGTKGEGG